MTKTKTSLQLIPQPKKLKLQKGSFAFPDKGRVGIGDASLAQCAMEARAMFRSSDVHAAVKGAHDDVVLGLEPSLQNQGYRLAISSTGVEITGADAAGVFYGLQTLEQILAQCGEQPLPCLVIEDWPDFADRGVYYDVARGRVPTLEQLFLLADVLAHFKINQLQLYIEHTFAFRRHPRIGKGASPLTAEDILQLDDYCRHLHIELVPSLASFGHLHPVLKLEEYRDLAEDWGVGRYVAPKDERPSWFHAKAWTLSPANPKTYEFLDSLFAEFLPLFSSKRFNICCDETWDLGLGQTYELCKKKGKGPVYLDHIKKVRALCRKYGKRVMFWGDIIRNYPELIKEIPKDVTVLDWGYGHNHPFDRIGDFKAAGLPFFACPGTSSWVSLFPRLPESRANIAGFAAAALKHGAQGLLNTDWGDGGHYNFMELSHYGYLFGADQSWNVGADQASFSARFARVFLCADSGVLAKAIDTLGDIAQLGVAGYYQAVWQHVLFALPGDAVLDCRKPIEASVSAGGRIEAKKIRFNAAFGRREETRLKRVREVFAGVAGRKDCDPVGVLPYWIFAIDTMLCAVHKLQILGPGGTDTPAARRALATEMTKLMKRFEALWLARNRRAEIEITLKRYCDAIKSLA